MFVWRAFGLTVGRIDIDTLSICSKRAASRRCFPGRSMRRLAFSSAEMNFFWDNAGWFLSSRCSEILYGSFKLVAWRINVKHSSVNIFGYIKLPLRILERNISYSVFILNYHTCWEIIFALLIFWAISNISTNNKCTFSFSWICNIVSYCVWEWRKKAKIDNSVRTWCYSSSIYSLQLICQEGTWEGIT